MNAASPSSTFRIARRSVSTFLNSTVSRNKIFENSLYRRCDDSTRALKSAADGTAEPRQDNHAGISQR